MVLSGGGEPELDRQIARGGSRGGRRPDRPAAGRPGRATRRDRARDLCVQIEFEQIQFLLDPLATRELYPVAALGRQTAVPLALWRAIRGPADVLALVRCGAATYVVIDPEQLGGISPARAAGRIAAAAGISALLGGRPSLGIATAAMLHLAAATPRSPTPTNRPTINSRTTCSPSRWKSPAA